MDILNNSTFIETNSIALISKHTTKSKVIYLILLVSVCVFFVSLFVISVDVNIQCRGIITTREKQSEVRSPIYGKLISVRLIENAYVNVGDTVAIVDTTEIQQSIEILVSRIQTIRNEITDLNYLTHASAGTGLNTELIKSLKYRQEAQRFIADVNYQKAEIENIKKDFERQKQLYNNKVIPQIEYEQSAYKFENAQLRYKQLIESRLGIWQDELKINESQLLTLQENMNSQLKEKLKCFITAPLSGFIQNLTSIQLGAVVFPNQELCRISPKDDLLVEMYISPTDIGYVFEKQKVRYRIDAFNANQWGFLEGSIQEISNDITLADGQILGFRVLAQLNGLSLNNEGKNATVRKGMTLTANLVLTNRTIAQLLFDDISDWLNPSNIKP
ncbi:MAG TPA: hypothetical protein DCQ31_15070 [Bacteroidales bacterium]|nr:hypothetical protein [Bacteroidales bacterium]